MARSSQIDRHWKLLRTLQTRGAGVPLADLARHLRVSERTIQRDIEMLQELGFPVSFREDEYGKRFWSMPHDFFRSGALSLTLTEAVSLHLAERLFSPLAGTHFSEGLRTLLEKIDSLLPQRAMAYFSGLNSTLLVRPFAATDYTRHRRAIQTLDDAARNNRTVEVVYQSLWRRDRYTTLFDPYGLVLHLDDLFAVGRSHRARAERIFKLSRVRSARPTDRHFRRPDDFNLREYFRSSFGIMQPRGELVDVTVRFTGVAAAMVEERIWHDSQQLERVPGEATLFESSPADAESLLASFRLGDLVEFKRWIKGFGDRAVVVSPEWLAHELRDELLAAATVYQR